jgi:ABC-2 type transport system ATP-binding protein
VSRREFWDTLAHLAAEGLTIVLATPYLDEAERCNRVGLMNQGRMIRCESPKALKQTLEEKCYEVEATDQRAAREFLQSHPGVLSVEPYGAKLHLFLLPDSSAEALKNNLAEHGISVSEFREIVPSLEDVFIGLVRKPGAQDAA